MRARFAHLACLLGLATCRAPPEPLAPPIPAAVPPVSLARPALVEAIAPRADLALRVDGLALRRAPFVLGLLALDDTLGDVLGKVQRTCAVDVLTGIDEVVASGRFDAPFPLVVARA